MSWVATAIVGSAIIGGIGANSAANTQAGATRDATAAQLSMFNTTQKNEQPYMQGGEMAMNELMAGIMPSGSSYTYGGTPGQPDKSGVNGFLTGAMQPPGSPGTPGTTVTGTGSLMPQSYKPYDMTAFQNSPEYQIMQNQTQNAVDAAGNRSSMTGGANSNNMKSLMGWTQGNATQGYSTGLNDYMSQFLEGNQARAQQLNTLSGVAGMGQNAAANLGGFSTQVGGQIGSNMIGAGNANAAGTVGVSNALTSGIGQGYNQWLQSQYLQNAPGNYNQSYDMGGGTGNISYSVPQ